MLDNVQTQRFSVAVAHLENDPEAHHEGLIVEALKEFKEVEVLRFDRTITLRGSQPEDRVRAGHEQARNFLHKSGAHVLIWGTVLHHEDTSLPKLYWTALKSPSPGLREQRYKWTDDLDLPALFWEDLAVVLRLTVATEHAEFAAQEGHFIADRLEPFIRRVRTLLMSSGQRKGWTPQGVAEVQFVLGNSLLTIGEQTGSREPLEEAVTAYREALKEYTRERVPLDWAVTQNNLGVALHSLGKRESGPERFEEAVTAYREALKEYTRERVPLQWAGAQNNLGNALRTLGERESGSKRLEEAVAAYQEALKERTRERVPLDWAVTQNNLGNALATLGERESGTERLEQAVAAYQEALKERTRERVPLDWAMTQNNLGNALATLGERESGTERLEEAVAAYREALKEYTWERVPLDWAITQNNLGVALREIGRRKKDAQLVCEALRCFLAAQEAFKDSAPYHASVTSANIKKALSLLKQEFPSSEYESCKDLFP
jgi:tetratricopeptide (TPR) repeat protein